MKGRWCFKDIGVNGFVRFIMQSASHLRSDYTFIPDYTASHSKRYTNISEAFICHSTEAGKIQFPSQELISNAIN